MVDKSIMFFGLLALVLVAVLGSMMYKKNNSDYSMVGGSQSYPAPNVDMADMAVPSSSDGKPLALRGMTDEQIQSEIDLHFRQPLKMTDTVDMLPEMDISGLGAGVDPVEDFNSKFAWQRTTAVNFKRRNWEGGAAMIRGDLSINPGNHDWFQHTLDSRDLTSGYIPKEICGKVEGEDLVYT